LLTPAICPSDDALSAWAAPGVPRLDRAARAPSGRAPRVVRAAGPPAAAEVACDCSTCAVACNASKHCCHQVRFRPTYHMIYTTWYINMILHYLYEICICFKYIQNFSPPLAALGGQAPQLPHFGARFLEGFRGVSWAYAAFLRPNPEIALQDFLMLRFLNAAN
jgi:hypothetical protein